MNIAIFTPSQNPYSETFIQAHKTYLKGNIFYFYGKPSGMSIEGHGELMSQSSFLWYTFIKKITRKPYGYVWQQHILKALKKHQIDVILVEYGNFAYKLEAALKVSRIPVVVHFHGYDASVTKVIKECKDYKGVFNYASKIVAVSRVMEQRLLDLGCPKDKLVYDVYGPQPEFLEVNAQFTKQQFIGIGRFVDKKAPYYIILAFAQVIKLFPEAQLILAGTGSLLNSCKNLIKYFKLENNIHCIGVISPEDYRQLLSESLAFVQHSIISNTGDMEGTPLAVLEASGAGLPVIATKHAGIPDVIIDGQTGILVDEHDVDAMANAMIKLLEHPKQAQIMGAKGKTHITSNFNLNQHIDKLQFTLEDVVNK